jgi:hypothetical protein
MAKGASYEDAIPGLTGFERRERRRFGDIGKVNHQGKELPDSQIVHEST